MAIGSLIPAGLGVFCCYFFWCQPARLVCQPLQPGNMQYTIVDDDSHLMRIMAWLQSNYLHGPRVNVSNSQSHWYFLHQDHWKNLPKSREHRNACNFCCKT